MGYKVNVFLGLFLATFLLISSGVAARQLEETHDEDSSEKTGVDDDAKHSDIYGRHPGLGGEYSGGGCGRYPGRGYPGRGYPGRGYPGRGYPGRGDRYPGDRGRNGEGYPRRGGGYRRGRSRYPGGDGYGGEFP